MDAAEAIRLWSALARVRIALNPRPDGAPGMAALLGLLGRARKRSERSPIARYISSASPSRYGSRCASSLFYSCSFVRCFGLGRGSGPRLGTTGASTSHRKCSNGFRKETGIRVVYDLYDSNEMTRSEAPDRRIRLRRRVPERQNLCAARHLKRGTYLALDRAAATALRQPRREAARLDSPTSIPATVTSCPTRGARPASATASASPHPGSATPGRQLGTGVRSGVSPKVSTCGIRCAG